MGQAQWSSHEKAKEALKLVQGLQHYFVERLDHLSETLGSNQPFESVSWLRDEGLHGGGERFVAKDERLFNRASVNVSQVHYDDEPSKALGSASAISTIIHPRHPLVPSMHMHISWTQMKEGHGYWRMMADLNPSIENPEDTALFIKGIKGVAPNIFDEAAQQGDKYFYIPALKRHRGVAHFYLEQYNSGDDLHDASLAKSFGERVIDTYIAIITAAIGKVPEASAEQLKQQLDYHTLYLFQVLTLDRGTTSGLLVHDQNDIGIMGSIPEYVNAELLASWETKVPEPQDQLVKALVSTLGLNPKVLVDDTMKSRLAKVVRKHYQLHPEALNMQASGNSVPPTVANHGAISS